MGETKIPMQELESKVQGAYAQKGGGGNCVILRYMQNDICI